MMPYFIQTLGHLLHCYIHVRCSFRLFPITIIYTNAESTQPTEWKGEKIILWWEQEQISSPIKSNNNWWYPMPFSSASFTLHSGLILMLHFIQITFDYTFVHFLFYALRVFVFTTSLCVSMRCCERLFGNEMWRDINWKGKCSCNANWNWQNWNRNMVRTANLCVSTLFFPLSSLKYGLCLRLKFNENHIHSALFPQRTFLCRFPFCHILSLFTWLTRV